LEGWNEKCLYCTYYHENQFAYPSRLKDKAIHQFTSINYNTALVSDRLGFNSQYNLSTFLAGCSRYLKKCSDFDLRYTTAQIEKKSTVLYPGINFDKTPGPTKGTSNVPVICWNHRWEHDKNPEEFFSALAELDSKGYSFKLVILGQSFRDVPEVFSWAQKRFAAQILQFGHVSSREEYLSWLRKCNIVVSTALHEFFGISVMEAVGAGCIPLVPDRLSYPELYPACFRYQDGGLTDKLGESIAPFMKGELPYVDIDLGSFDWNALKQSYTKWLL
jgi:glycosyltransferase involved in cell wall biosynthesis